MQHQLQNYRMVQLPVHNIFVSPLNYFLLVSFVPPSPQIPTTPIISLKMCQIERHDINLLAATRETTHWTLNYAWSTSALLLTTLGGIIISHVFTAHLHVWVWGWGWRAPSLKGGACGGCPTPLPIGKGLERKHQGATSLPRNFFLIFGSRNA